MATAMFAETLDNFQHSTRLIPESRSCTLNSSRENLKTRISINYRTFCTNVPRYTAFAGSFNAVWIYINGSYAQKWLTKFYLYLLFPYLLFVFNVLLASLCRYKNLCENRRHNSQNSRLYFHLMQLVSDSVMYVRYKDYTTLQPRRQPSSYSPPWEPQILLGNVLLETNPAYKFENYFIYENSWLLGTEIMWIHNLQVYDV
jgi:hypothetical protein